MKAQILCIDEYNSESTNNVYRLIKIIQKDQGTYG